MGKIYKLSDKAGNVVYPMTIGDAIAVDGSTLTAKITTDATQTKRGMMSSADKIKLDGIETGAQVNTVTSVAGKTGAVTLVKGDVGLGNVTNDAQIKGLASGTTENHVLTFGTDGYTVKDSGKTIGTSVPEDAVFTDTTYSFAEGSTNGAFSVTPAGGDAVSVAIHGLAAAAYKDIDSSISDTASVKLPTTAAVAEYVEKQMVSVLKYKGTVDSTHPLPATHAVGDVYVVAEAGTYAGQSCEIGDYIICKTKGTTASDSHWDVISGENQVVDGNVTLDWGTKSDIATVDGTTIHVTMPANPNTDTTVDSAAHHYTPSKSETKSAASATGTSGSTVQVVTGIEVDSKGHVTGVVSGAATDTTYESKTAAQGGTDESLVTTGEKFTWNAKYAKPSDGIPTEDLDSSVQSALAKANSAIQDISGKQDKITASGILKGNGSGTVTAATAGTDYLAPVTAVTDTPTDTQIIKSVTQGTDGQIAVTKSTFTIAKSVPADAVFTDTDTKVTSADNHYAPSADESSKLSADAKDATAAWSIDVVKGLTIERDAKGHVTGLSVTSGKIPANPNTDTKVTSAANHYVPVGVDASTQTAKDATGTSGATVQVITSIKMDERGHVTGITSGAATDTTYVTKTAYNATTNKVVTEADILYATKVKDTEYDDDAILAIIA